MARLCWLILLFVGFSCLLLADEPSSPLHSTHEVKQHLFGELTFSGDFGPRDLRSEFQQVEQQRKSVALAAVYSLLLPGMGELYAGNFSAGKYFLIGEGVLWLTYTTFEVYGNSLRDDSRAFAASRGGVNPSNNNGQFYIDIGNYSNVAAYNEAQLRDRNPDRLYDPAAGYSWQWDSEAARLSYRDQRIESENMYNNRRFVVGAILINHLASAIHAARAAVLYNKSLNEQSGEIRFKAGVLGSLSHPHGIVLTVSRSL